MISPDSVSSVDRYIYITEIASLRISYPFLGGLWFSLGLS